MTLKLKLQVMCLLNFNSIVKAYNKWYTRFVQNFCLTLKDELYLNIFMWQLSITSYKTKNTKSVFVLISMKIRPKKSERSATNL